MHIALHGIIDPRQPGYDHPLSCSSARLRWVVDTLRQANYQLVTCTEYVKRYQSGERLATLSFDDGYRNNLKAIQLLQTLGVVGTFFPIVCTLQGKLPPNRLLTLAIERVGIGAVHDWLLEYFDGSPFADFIADPEWGAPGPFQNDRGAIKRIKTVWNSLISLGELRIASHHLRQEFLADIDERKMCHDIFLTADELRRAAEFGMEIGSHTTSHVLLGNQSRLDCHHEVKESVETLGALLGQKVTSLCLPYGGDEVAAHVLGAARGNGVSLWNYYERTLPKTSLADSECPAFHRFDHQLFNPNILF